MLSALLTEHSRQFGWSQAWSMLLGAAVKGSFAPALFMDRAVRNSKQSCQALKKIGHMPRNRKDDNGLIHIANRCSYASLKSVLAENLQLQGFRQLGTPGNRKGWSLPKAEDQVTLNA